MLFVLCRQCLPMVSLNSNDTVQPILKFPHWLCIETQVPPILNSHCNSWHACTIPKLSSNKGEWFEGASSTYRSEESKDASSCHSQSCHSRGLIADIDLWTQDYSYSSGSLDDVESWEGWLVDHTEASRNFQISVLDFLWCRVWMPSSNHYNNMCLMLVSYM